MDGKGIVNGLYLSIICDLIAGDLEIIICQVNHRVAGKPVLASYLNVILLGISQLIVFGTGGRVGCHVQSSLGIRNNGLTGAFNGIAAVILSKSRF